MHSGYSFLDINFESIIPEDFDKAVAEHVCHPKKQEYALRWRDLAADSPAFKQFVMTMAKKLHLDPQICAQLFASGFSAGYILAERGRERRVEIVSEF